MFEQVLADYKKGTNWTLDKLGGDPQALKELSAALAERGIDSNKIGKRLGGTTAMVVAYGHNSVLRIVDAKEEPKTNAPVDWKQWQPARDFGTVKGFNVEIHHKALPMDQAIEKGIVTRADALELTKGLIGDYARDGKFLWDCKPDNLAIGFTPDGKPVAFMLDPGAAVPMAEKNALIKGLDDHTNLARFAVEMDEITKKAGKPDPAILANPEAYLESLKNTVIPPAMDRQELQKRIQGFEQNIADLPAAAPVAARKAEQKPSRWAEKLQSVAKAGAGILFAVGGGTALWQGGAALLAGTALTLGTGAIAMLAGGAALAAVSFAVKKVSSRSAGQHAAPQTALQDVAQGKAGIEKAPTLEYEGNVRADGKSWATALAEQQRQSLAR